MTHGDIQTGSRAYAIIRPSNDPDLMLPVRGMVADVSFATDLPTYRISVNFVYEGILYVRRHFPSSYWKCRSGRPSQVFVPREALRTIDDFNTWITDQPFRFEVESPFVFRTKEEMLSYFNKLQDYLVIRHMRRLREVVSHREYSGRFKVLNYTEFESRLWSAFADRFETRQDFDRWCVRFRVPKTMVSDREKREKAIKKRKRGDPSGGGAGT